MKQTTFSFTLSDEENIYLSGRCTFGLIIYGLNDADSEQAVQVFAQ